MRISFLFFILLFLCTATIGQKKDRQLYGTFVLKGEPLNYHLKVNQNGYAFRLYTLKQEVPPIARSLDPEKLKATIQKLF